jgi:hypothetical protein
VDKSQSDIAPHNKRDNVLIRKQPKATSRQIPMAACPKYKKSQYKKTEATS